MGTFSSFASHIRGTAVKWSNASCGQQGRLARWHHQYHHHIPHWCQKVRACYSVLFCYTRHQTIRFHFPMMLKHDFWETRRIFSWDFKMLSPLIKLPDYFLYSSVVWWRSRWWVQVKGSQWGLKRDNGGPRWGWLLCCPENRPWFPGTMQLMRNSPRKIWVWHHGFLKLTAEPTLLPQSAPSEFPLLREGVI